MAWERRPKGDQVRGYFYLSIRVPGRRTPVKKYLGTGPEAEAESARIAEKCAQRAADRAALAAAEHEYARCDALLNEFTAWAEALTAAWLVRTGHHYHRGSWRKKRGHRQPDV